MTLTRYSTEPDNYDWNSTRAISLSDSDVPSEGKIERSSASTPELDDEKKDEPTATVASAVLDAQDPGVVAPALEEAAKDPALDRAVLQKVFVRSLWISGIFALVIAIIIPIPMFASRYVFSRRFFEVWVACVCFPLGLLISFLSDYADTYFVDSFSIVWVLLAGGFCMCVAVSSR